jgi:hypothetical protein
MFTFKKFAAVGVAAFAAFTISCTEEDDPDPAPTTFTLVKKNFTLSSQGASYGDLDNGQTYRAAALTDAIKGNIDVVAYYQGVDTGDDIINPCVTTIGEDCGYPELYNIPSQYWSDLKTAETSADIKAFLNAFADGTIEAAGEEDRISLAAGKAILVLSTDVKYYVVIMGGNGTGATIDLDFFKATP